MKKDLTELVIIVDRSGSMSSSREESEAGLNRLIEDQRKDDGECNLSILQFDDVLEWTCEGVNIADAPKYKLEPRGMTALDDAIGMGVEQTGYRLADMKEEDRPSLVIVAIVTDGGENASQKYKRAEVQEMVERQKNKYNWKFTFIGANIDAAVIGGGYGISSKDALSLSGNNKIWNAYQNVSTNFSQMKSAVSRGVAGADVGFEYSDEDREALKEE